MERYRKEEKKWKGGVKKIDKGKERYRGKEHTLEEMEERKGGEVKERS